MQLVLTIKKDNPDLEVVIIAEEVNMQDGIQAIKNGAFDYISKINDNIRIIPLLNQIMEKKKFTQRMKILEKK